MDPVQSLRKYLDGPPKVPQEKFAAAVGVGQSTVSKWKAGVLVPTMKAAVAIERITGIPMTAWIGRKPRYMRKERAA